jgi:hypothetical protein
MSAAVNEQAPSAVSRGLTFLLTRTGSWTSARWDQHLRDHLGDAPTEEVIRWLAERGILPYIAEGSSGRRLQEEARSPREGKASPLTLSAASGVALEDEEVIAALARAASLNVKNPLVDVARVDVALLARAAVRMRVLADAAAARALERTVATCALCDDEGYVLLGMENNVKIDPMRAEPCSCAASQPFSSLAGHRFAEGFHFGGVQAFRDALDVAENEDRRHEQALDSAASASSMQLESYASAVANKIQRAIATKRAAHEADRYRR